MYFLQATQNGSGISSQLFLGTLGMFLMAIGIVVFVIFHQRKVIRYQMQMKKLEEEKQQMLLQASIRFQEEERQRIAADLHDDAGPLLATVRLYLNENLINQDKGSQLQSILQARQIIDDTITLI
ncbi:MAG: histidine kinase, partial [Ginsengibacter sp.]